MREEAQDLCMQQTNIFDVSGKHSADLPHVAGQDGWFQNLLSTESVVFNSKTL
jgi:hypothetical protein